MRESLGTYESRRRNESNIRQDRCVARTASLHPVLAAVVEERERTRWDPKDGELCLRRMKPEETLVEVRRDSDVQIDRRTWV